VFFKINLTNGVSVYEQISRQIAFAIASGAIEVGQLVPSVRSLSRDLAVNPQVMEEARQSQLTDQEIDKMVAAAVTKSKKTFVKNRSTTQK